MKFSYLIHLGQNMWRGPYADPFPLGGYSKKMITEHKAWREIIDFLPQMGINTLIIDLAEGVQYRSHPCLACDGAWTVEFLKEELKYIRSLGITPIPKLNFSTTHDMWLKEYSNMVSTPVYYKVIEDLICEVSEIFDKPEYFHFGLDEEFYDPFIPHHVINLQKPFGITHVRGKKLFWEDFNYFADLIRKYGSKPWAWACMVWFNTEECVKNIPKDVILSNACYERILNYDLLPPWHRNSVDGYRIFAENGFKQAPTAMQTESSNIDDTMTICKNLKGIEGYIMAPWFRSREIDILTHKAAAKLYGYAIKKHYSEVRE